MDEDQICFLKISNRYLRHRERICTVQVKPLFVLLSEYVYYIGFLIPPLIWLEKIL